MSTLEARIERLAALHARRATIGLATLTAASLGLCLCGLAWGASGFDPLAALAGLAAPGADPILWELRVPRVVFAALHGATLALAGAVLQALFRNPLADPGLLGVSGGGAFGAGLAMALAPAMGALALYGPAIGAFVGALAALAATLAFGRSGGRPAVGALLLAGIGVNALAFAGLGALTYIADDARLRDLATFNLGTMSGVSWLTAPPALALMALAGFVLLSLRRPLDALLLGVEEARALGVNVDRVRLIAIVACALAVGAGVAAAGVIGFLGLVAPHMARLLVGGRHAVLLPASAALGAGLLAAADLIGRTAIAPAEAPAGLVAAIVGAPAFLWLLARARGGIDT